LFVVQRSSDALAAVHDDPLRLLPIMAPRMRTPSTGGRCSKFGLVAVTSVKGEIRLRRVFVTRSNILLVGDVQTFGGRAFLRGQAMRVFGCWSADGGYVRALSVP